MPEPDPARPTSIHGIGDLKSHSPNVFGASAAGSPKGAPGGTSHHTTPVFGSSTGRKPDWVVALDSLPYGFVLLGPQQELRHENATCRQLLGYGIAEKGGIEGWLSALCPDTAHREKVITSWREQIWRTQLTRIFTLRTADQVPKEIEFRSSLLRDGGITLTFEDVTERQRGEETLRHGKLKFRALFTHTRTGTVLVDRTGRIIDANPAFAAVTGKTLRQLRLTTVADLLRPEEARDLAELESRARPGDVPAPRHVHLQGADGETERQLSVCAVGDDEGPPAMAIYLFERPDQDGSPAADERLRAVSQKAQALLKAAPDLILLLDDQGRVSDFSPPPKPWKELVLDDSWRGKPVGQAWPVLGNLLDRCHGRLRDDGPVIHAELRGQDNDLSEFHVTLSPCGDGEVLVAVRNQSAMRNLRDRDLWQSMAISRAPLPILRVNPRGVVVDSNPAALSAAGSSSPVGREIQLLVEEFCTSGTVPEFFALEQDGKTSGSVVFLRSEDGAGGAAGSAGRERRQHGFRNQLQLVTSLFSLEPQGAAAREAFFKWQIRLRAIALASPADDSGALGVASLLRELADEICSLLGRGPGRREVIVTGDESLRIEVAIATPFILLIAELMRLVLGTRQTGPGAEVYIHLASHPDGFQVSVRPGRSRQFIFSDREAEVETLELLTEQIRARLEATDPEQLGIEWVLVIPKPGA